MNALKTAKEKFDVVTLIIPLVVFVLIIIIMISIRVRIGAEFEVKNSDILIALIPIAMWLLLSGKVKVFEFGGLKIESAFAEASKADITEQVTSLPYEGIEIAMKVGPSEIPNLIRNETAGLSFYLGSSRYDPRAVFEYLDQLTPHSFFKYILLYHSDEKFFCIADARGLFSLFSIQGESRVVEYINWLESEDSDNLSTLPGFIGFNDAIRMDSDKQSALEKMEELNVEMLPVIDSDDRFVGVVERSRLASSLIIEVANKVR